MYKVVALLGDYWHKEEDLKAGLEAAIRDLSTNQEIDITDIQFNQVMEELIKNPDLFIPVQPSVTLPLQNVK